MTLALVSLLLLPLLQDPGAGRLWSGAILGADGVARTSPAATRERIEEDLARLRLEWAARRDPAAAQAALERLRLSVNDARFAGDRAPLYAAVARERARVLAATGRKEEARAALGEFLLPEGFRLADGSRPELIPPDAAAVAAARRAAADPELTGFRDKLGPLRRPPAEEPDAASPIEQEPAVAGLSPAAEEILSRSFGPPSPALEREVRRLLADGGDKEILNLGLRAAPALARLVLERLEGADAAGPGDPLDLLLRVDPAGTLELMNAVLDRAPDAWALHALELLLRRGDPHLVDGLWIDDAGNQPRPRPGLASLTVRLLRRPLTRWRALPLLSAQVDFEALDPRLARTVADLAAELGPVDAGGLLDLLLAGERPAAGTESVWSLLLEEGRPGWLRQRAAAAFLLRPDWGRSTEALLLLLAAGPADARPAFDLRKLPDLLEEVGWPALVAGLAQRPDLAERILPPAGLAADRPPAARAFAIAAAARLERAGVEEAALDLLADPAVVGSNRDLTVTLDLLVPLFPEDARRQAAFLRLVLREPSLPEEVRERLLGDFGPLPVPAAAALAREILDRYPPAGDTLPTRRAIAALARAPRPEDRAILTEALRTAESPEVLASAVEGLRRIGTAEAGLELARALRLVGDPGVRDRIEQALAAIRSQIQQEQEWLEQVSPPAPETGPEADPRAAALRELLAMLADPDPEFRAEAAGVLAGFGVFEAAPAVIRLLRDPDEQVRRAARQAVERLKRGGAPAPPKLLF